MAWYRINGAYVCVPPKNGSTSFKVAVCGKPSYAYLREWARERDAGPFNANQLGKHGPRYLAVRHPESRFASLWRSCQHQSYHRQSFVVEHGLEACTPDQLMDVIETAENPHWARQSDWVVPRLTPVPYDRLLERLSLPVRWENRTHADTPTLPVERIRAHYRDDYELWKSVPPENAEGDRAGDPLRA